MRDDSHHLQKRHIANSSETEEELPDVHRMPSRNDDNQILVHNEEIPDDILDNRFGGQVVVDHDAGGELYDSVVHSTTQHVPRPNDKYNFTYLVFYILGAATMAPWNFFITAEDVSKYRK